MLGALTKEMVKEALEEIGIRVHSTVLIEKLTAKLNEKIQRQNRANADALITEKRKTATFK